MKFMKLPYSLLATIVILPLLSSGCLPAQPNAPLSALQRRVVQSRDYETDDTRMVMKAVLNTFQDQGFVVKNAVSDLGLISAVRETGTKDPSDAIINSIIWGEEGEWEKHRVIEATANVTQVGDVVRVRLSLQEKIISNRGTVMEIIEVTDSAVYQALFSDVDKGIFLQKERL